MIISTEEANRIVTEGARRIMTPSELISREIINFKTSKKWKWMIDGSDYYNGKHAILNKRRTSIGEGGAVENITNLPNSIEIDNQYKKMVKQKTNYLCGKPFSIKGENSQYVDILNAEYFNRCFFRQLKNITKDALNCGIGWLYCYYDETGKFSFKKFRPYECIPGWRDVDHTQLEYMIRFYDVQAFNGLNEEIITKVEYYTLSGCDYFQYHDGQLLPSAPYHTDYLSINGVTYNWTKMPFVAFKYNDDELPLIVNCKSLQDGLNRIISNFEDNMREDMRNTIMVLVNYDGENLGEFRRNLATYGAVKVRSTDGVQGDVKTLQVEVNADNYKSIIDIFKKAIIENCMGYDAKDDRLGGTPNEMNIRSMYNDIDLDASDMETEYQAALEELMYFINLHLLNTGRGNFMDEKIDIIFNTDMTMDEGTTIDNIQKSVGILSTETLIANHPWVTDPQSELKKLDQEKQKNLDEYGGLGQMNQGTNISDQTGQQEVGDV